jgi:putative nucleotidyltransferase with HDIG domain
LSTIVAATLYRSLAEALGTNVLGYILSFMALASAFFITNQLLVSVALSLMDESRFGVTLTHVMSTAGSGVVYDCLASPVALAVALVFKEWGVLALLLVSLPSLLFRHSYASNQKLQRANTDVLRVLIKSMETRDSYTSGHSVRVSHLARAIAEQLKLSPAQIDEIEKAALLHDIGKIDTVYAEIVGKQGALTESERSVIVTHPTKGADFLKTLSSFKEQVILSVRHHHERWDGRGYPDGLSGDRIPLAARVIMLCDSIDAMLSDRPYRRALTVDQVRAELLRCAGSQFDPTIVHIVLQRNTLERAATLASPQRQTFTQLSAVG